MRGRNSRYTFVIEFLGGTYVHQARGESPDMALRGWLRAASAEELEWAGYRAELMRALLNHSAAPIEGCQNVWCMSGVAAEHLFLIHIIGNEGGSAGGRGLADEQQIGSEMRRWGHGAPG